MEDDSDSSDEYILSLSSSRKLLGMVLLILVFFLYVIYSFYNPDDFLVGFFLFPPLIFLLLAWSGCCGDISSKVEPDLEENILHSMQRRALVASKIDGRDIYRCPNCELSFDVENALPVEDDVVLCPFCKNRLILDEGI